MIWSFILPIMSFFGKHSGIVSKAKSFLTPKNIAMIVGVILLIFFIWSYLSTRSENVQLKFKLETASSEIVKANANLQTCYTEQENLNKKFVIVQKEYEDAIASNMKSAEEVCLRKDKVSNLNKVKPIKNMADKPPAVKELENSLNNRFNKRGFQ